MRLLIVLLLAYINLYAFSYTITANELNKNISKKFPIEKKIFLSKFLFSNPKFEIEKASNLILFECDVSNSSISLNDGTVPIFRVYAKSAIRYDGQNIYLKKIEIERIKNEKVSAKLEKKLKIGISLLLNLYFSKKPIYKISEASYSMKIANSVIDDVIIKDGVIKLLILE
jgi:hypothetical protein